MDHLRDALVYAGGRLVRFSALGWLMIALMMIAQAHGSAASLCR